METNTLKVQYSAYSIYTSPAYSSVWYWKAVGLHSVLGAMLIDTQQWQQ